MDTSKNTSQKPPQQSSIPTMEQLRSELTQFTGTLSYTRVNPLFRHTLCTDGAKYVFERMQAFWLHDLIAGFMFELDDWENVSNNITIEVEAVNATAVVSYHYARYNPDTNGYNEVTKSYPIKYTSLPDGKLTFFAGQQGIKEESYWIIMVPSEY